ncbi:AAA family ATPase [Dethiobacter alkaliphilus]|uniref:hypothetical protein n=1 Tax=Dethiobacter alkaliphilus TaxID=427926 RepID=UPI002226321C|nr:hypothetical protein [Dethiobacter alkaliphilus]MCW3488678.1 hypothetical protein [Dethiobacter alkaliphilus]
MNNSFKEATEAGPTMQVHEMVKELYLQSKKFWLELLKAEERYLEKMQRAEEKLNGVDARINELKKHAGINEVPLQRLTDLKSQLKPQVDKITDPAIEIKAYVQEAVIAREELKNAERSLENSLNWHVGKTGKKVAAIFIILVGLFFAWSSEAPSVFAFIFVPGGLYVLYCSLKADTSAGKFHRQAALADLVLDRLPEYAQKEYRRTCEEAEARYKQEKEETRKRFFSHLEQASSRIREYNAGIGMQEAPWEHRSWQNWTPVSNPAVSLRFGTVIVNTSNDT